MSSGIGVDDECVSTWDKVKMGKAHRFVTFKIDHEAGKVVVDYRGGPDAPYDEFKENLPKDDCRYIVYDVQKSFGDDGLRNKLVFIFWAPDCAKIKNKMTYASTKEAFKKVLQGIYCNIQATDAEEISYEFIEEQAFANTK